MIVWDGCTAAHRDILHSRATAESVSSCKSESKQKNQTMDNNTKTSHLLTSTEYHELRPIERALRLHHEQKLSQQDASDATEIS